jgi:hypothetical protein
MEVGFLRDRAQGRLSRPAEWMRGVPDPTFFGGVDIGNTTRFIVEAFRCEKCGFLEQYAVGEPKPGILGSM